MTVDVESRQDIVLTTIFLSVGAGPLESTQDHPSGTQPDDRIFSIFHFLHSSPLFQPYCWLPTFSGQIPIEFGQVVVVAMSASASLSGVPGKDPVPSGSAASVLFNATQ